jgi:hypothetical protein
MALGDPNRGWSDPIGTFMRLQLSVKILASGKGQRKVRMDEATSALTGLIPEYFPAALRERAFMMSGVGGATCSFGGAGRCFAADRVLRWLWWRTR